MCHSIFVCQSLSHTYMHACIYMYIHHTVGVKNASKIFHRSRFEQHSSFTSFTIQILLELKMVNDLGNLFYTYCIYFISWL